VFILALLAFRFLLRSDGLVDRTTRNGTVDATFQAPNGVPYVAINTQFVGPGSEENDGSCMANYLVRIDGVIDRILFKRVIVEKQIPPPPPTKYISASAMSSSCELASVPPPRVPLKGAASSKLSLDFNAVRRLEGPPPSVVCTY
jgi:hypothetical protein